MARGTDDAALGRRGHARSGERLPSPEGQGGKADVLRGLSTIGPPEKRPYGHGEVTGVWRQIPSSPAGEVPCSDETAGVWRPVRRLAPSGHVKHVPARGGRIEGPTREIDRAGSGDTYADLASACSGSGRRPDCRV